MQSAETNILAPGWSERSLDLPGASERKSRGNPFGLSRDFLENQFIYLAISPRARGLSIGVNMNPDAGCNFDCVYCDVDRRVPRPSAVLDCDLAGRELEQTLALVHGGGLRVLPPYNALPAELLRLRHVALSGEGEPTVSAKFLEMVQTVAHVRARGRFPFFKLVLITNGTCLDVPEVQQGIALFTGQDEIWAKLDAGTQAQMELVNRATVPLETVLEKILFAARRRPVIIQSLFSAVDGIAPSREEIAAFAGRLRELKEAGANIPLVQIYSATRPMTSTRVAHLPLRTMAEIAGAVRSEAGIAAEVF